MSLDMSRWAIHYSLAFHIIFSVLSISMPLLLCIVPRNQVCGTKILVRGWPKAVALIFIFDTVSCTVISFELGLLWPTYSNFAWDIIGPTLPLGLCT